MRRVIRNVAVRLRRVVLGLVLLVPAGVRAWLSRNPLLTRVYVFFDRSKYEPILDELAHLGIRCQESVAGILLEEPVR